MRKKMKKMVDTRTVFTGVFVRFGEKSGYKGPEKTILLADIRDESGEILTDHLWFNFTKGFQRAYLHKNDRIQFHARVKPYMKGYRGWDEEKFSPITMDFKLSHPSQVKVIN